MDLWIRSQNRTGLTKVNKNIGLKYSDNKTIIADYVPDFSDNYDGSYDVLGTYKTKERALEVLNEIQETMCIGKFNYEDKDKSCYQDCYRYKSDIIAVYEMPEE